MKHRTLDVGNLGSLSNRGIKSTHDSHNHINSKQAAQMCVLIIIMGLTEHLSTIEGR